MPAQRFDVVEPLGQEKRKQLHSDQCKEQIYAYLAGGWPRSTNGYAVDDVGEAFQYSCQDINKHLVNPARKDPECDHFKRETLECHGKIAREALQIMLEMVEDGYLVLLLPSSDELVNAKLGVLSI